MSAFDLLNSEQLEAVECLEGPSLIIAGAGSGKTRVVTFRIAHMIEKGIPPSSILALTFTNKAAGEMKERVRKLTDHNVLVCTFHSLGVRILRESIESLGYHRDFTIYDEEDSEKLLKICLNDVLNDSENSQVKAYKQAISKAKNDLLLPDSENFKVNRSLDKSFSLIYSAYQERLKKSNAVDFDDLLFLPVHLFQIHPDILAHYQQRWTYLLIDEYQDTNHAQYTFSKLLVANTRNIFAVGDPDQSIYSWRGAKIKNILNFEMDFPQAKIIRLEQNYRSTQHILKAANTLISNNEQRYEKKLWSDLGEGHKIQLFTSENEKEEVLFVVKKIQERHEDEHIPFNEVAIFYRTNAQSRIFEDQLLQRRIPYIIVGGISFYKRKEIKDILAFLNMIKSSMDEIAFTRTLNIPKRGFGETTIEKIRTHAIKEKLAIFEYCIALVEGHPLQHSLKLSSKQREGLKNFAAIIQKLRQESKEIPLSQLVASTIEKTHYVDLLSEEPESYEDRKENLDALVAKAVEWEASAQDPSLTAFLEELSLKTSLDESSAHEDRVNLMTIHNSKGLEYQLVFLVGMEEGLFPHIASNDNLEDLEEERRLCYVGMTRAKKHLYITHAKARFSWGKLRHMAPSTFLREIPMSHAEIVKDKKTASTSSFSHSFSFKTHPTNEIEENHKENFIKQNPEKCIQLEHPFEEGEIIFHQEFGVGVIQSIHEGSVGLMYRVLFNKDRQLKTLVAKYARLTRLQ